MFNLSRFFTVFSLCLLSLNLLAASPTAAQIAQFKQLPEAQQTLLASQYGMNIDELKSLSTQGEKPIKKQDDGKTIQPRNVDKENITDGKTGKLKAFGYDLFAGDPMSLTPLNDLPVPNNYLLGVGDELSIKIFGKKTENYSLEIDREGAIYIPDLGPFQARGLTYQQARKEITALIKRSMIGVEANISLGKLKTIQVFVLGSAYKPGSYVISSLSTVTQAIKAAGGVDKLGSLRQINVKRDNKVIKKIDLYDLLISGDTSADISLKQGDVVFIPIKNKMITIDGAVKRPAIYELKDEKNINAVLALAGGLDAKAYPKVQLTRSTKLGKKLIDLDLQKESAHQSVQFENGDSLYINESSDVYHNGISLSGAAVHPGVYEWTASTTVSSIIKSLKLDLRKDADLNNALLVREISADHKISVMHFNLLAAVSKPNSSDDLKLQVNDQIIVLNKDSGSILESNTDRQDKEKTTNKPNVRNSFSSRNQNASADTNKTEVDQQLEISDLDDKSEKENEVLNIRAKMLAPIISQLKAQADYEHAVQIVDIQGAVKFPGIYPLFEDADLQTLINIAGGLKEATYLTEGELSRIKLVSGKSRIIYNKINIANAMKGDASDNVKLVSKDRILIFSKPEWREDYKVTLAGEVKFPGQYGFNRGETLYDVIQRAGGVTQYAYPQGAVFARESLRKKEKEQLSYLHEQLRQEVTSLSFRRQSSTNPVQSSSAQSALEMVDKLGVAKAVGRMSINLEKIIADDKEQNIKLENQDFLYIPPFRKVISVIGQVQFPTAHIFEANKSIDDYLALSGGTKLQADKDRVYVIRANGSVYVPNQSFWFSRQDKPLLPGDTIVVPRDTNYMDTLTAFTSATQIMYQLGVAWSAISD